MLSFLNSKNFQIRYFSFKLEIFLRQKLAEMKSESDNLLISTILQDAPKSIQSITEKGKLKLLPLCILQSIKRLFFIFHLKMSKNLSIKSKKCKVFLE